jgi:signal transduction histidine kinase
MRRLTRGEQTLGGLAAIALGAGLTSLLATRAPAALEPWAVVAGWSFIGGGLIVWTRRPENRTGPLMVLTGLAFFANRLSLSDDATLRTIGLWVTPIHLAILTHTLLALPTGRLETTTRRAIVAGVYLDFGLLVHAPLLLGPIGLGAALRQASYVIGAALLAAAALDLLQRWRSGSAAWRNAVAPVLWVGALTLGALFAWGVNAALGGPFAEVASWGLRLAFVAIPYAFLAVLLRSHLARASVAQLVVELDASVEPGALRDALARTLGDPTLTLAYWLPAEQRYVDVDGHPVVLPAPDDGRTSTFVERNGYPVAALIHDRALSDEPELVKAACAAAALALDNERLQAELRARLDELSASRARIVRATDLERKRIERNLHDGTQQRLTSIAMGLGLAEKRLQSEPQAAAADLRQAKTALIAALAELRSISQGIHPAILTERGLAPALQDLAYAAPIPVEVRCNLDGRLPEAVEAGAYYVIAEGLANVVKHSGATCASITLLHAEGRILLSIRDDGIGGADALRGTGLSGLADRVGSLGGSLQVDSRRGHGTDLRAEIPCA